MTATRPAPQGGLQCAPLAAPIPPHLLGHAEVSPDGPVEAGSWQSFVLTYTAGHYGIDDSGALRVCFRFAADHSKPQLSDPKGAGYTTVVASNNAVLECRFDQKGNVRPYDQTLSIKVVNGYLKPGDTLTVTFGDRSAGAPGMRVQTFIEERFAFHVLVDPVATYTFQSLPVQPAIGIVAGPAARHLIVLPSLRRPGEPFRIGVKAEDRWGNPTSTGRLGLTASGPVRGLPREIAATAPGRAITLIEDVVAEQAGALAFTLWDEAGTRLAGQSMQVVAEAPLLPYWADFHAQSEETIGTGSLERYFDFCRNEAMLDIASHQGNDFQITEDFWRRLNALTARLDTPGRFVTLPGYEWSGNTALGGDRNVFFATEGRPIRRSSHALVPDQGDIGLDCPTAGALFAALDAAGEDAVCFAHCGGRYADLGVAHDARLETAVEVHSSWGSFDWLLQDALRAGHRVGVVANSDGHKGRPGAEYPGASSFGAIGGLTCLLLAELSRPAVIEALRRRRHYATSGGPNGRLHLGVTARLDARLCERDPALGPCATTPASRLTMGDIAETGAETAEISVSVAASAGVERIELFNGLDLIETIRSYGEAELGRRVRVLMEGAAYRGRFRQVNWNGTAELAGARIEAATPINFFNPDRVLSQKGENGLSWTLITTGNFGGFDIRLDQMAGARLKLRTPLIEAEAELDQLPPEGQSWSVPGPLPRQITLSRLPDDPLPQSLDCTREIALHKGPDNPIHVRVTLEDGTRAWSSPIYIIRK